MSVKGIRRMLVGEDMPDKDDPKTRNGMRGRWRQDASLPGLRG